VKPAARAPASTFSVRETQPSRPSEPKTRTEPIPAFGSKAATAPAPAPSPARAVATTVAEPPPELVMPEIEEPIETIPEEPFAESTLAKTADVDTRILADAPVDEPPPSTQYIPPPSLAKSAPAPVIEPEPEPEPIPEPPPAAPEPEIDFAQTEKPAKAPEPKHVKVRSSVDIMAELEALRKRATTATPSAPKPKKEPVTGEISLPAIPKPKRDVHRTLNLQLPSDVAARAKFVRVTVSFENDEGAVQSQEQSVELADGADVRSLSLDVKIALD